MDAFQIDGVLADDALVAELHSRLGPSGAAPGDVDDTGRPTPSPSPSSSSAAPSGGSRRGTVLAERSAPPLDGPLADHLARPSLLVGPAGFELPEARTWQERLVPWGRRLVAGAAAVGRVEGPNEGAVPGPLYGSAVLVADNVAVTAADVAAAVGRALESGATVRLGFGATRLTPGAPQAAVVRATVSHSAVAAVSHSAADAVAAADAVGVIVLALPADAERSLPAPLSLLAAGTDEGGSGPAVVAVVGCPPEPGATDPARPLSAPKRLAPGLLRGGAHDATVLSGSAGAAVLDVLSGALLGLQPDPSGGPVLTAGAIVDAVRAQLPTTTLVVQLDRAPGGASDGNGPPAVAARTDESAVAPQLSAVDLGGRRGYDPSFLGGADLTVALPVVPAPLDADLVVVDSAGSGTARFALPYEHFSVVMHAGRRMALFVAGNLDGSSAQPIKRHGDPWARDPRLAADTQWGNDLYDHNDLDRGHQVRRLDPAWGSTASVGERDTFFFTNSCPQFHRFNDGIWGDLEDYLLNNASTLDFRATIFTGPVFGPGDPAFRGALIPMRFWKVAVM